MRVLCGRRLQLQWPPSIFTNNTAVPGRTSCCWQHCMQRAAMHVTWCRGRGCDRAQIGAGVFTCPPHALSRTHTHTHTTSTRTAPCSATHQRYTRAQLYADTRPGRPRMLAASSSALLSGNTYPRMATSIASSPSGTGCPSARPVRSSSGSEHRVAANYSCPLVAAQLSRAAQARGACTHTPRSPTPGAPHTAHPGTAWRARRPPGLPPRPAWPWAGPSS